MRLFYAGVSNNNNEFGYVPDAIEIVNKDSTTTTYFVSDGWEDYENGLYGCHCCDLIDSKGNVVEDSMSVFLQIVTAKKVIIYFYPADTSTPDVVEKAKHDYFSFCHGRLFDDEDNSVNFEFEAKLKFDF